MGFLWSVSCISQSQPTKKYLLRGKSGPDATFDLIFVGSGWPWVWEFVGFIAILMCFPTQQSVVSRKHPLVGVAGAVGVATVRVLLRLLSLMADC